MDTIGRFRGNGTADDLDGMPPSQNGDGAALHESRDFDLFCFRESGSCIAGEGSSCAVRTGVGVRGDASARPTSAYGTFRREPSSADERAVWTVI